MSHHEESLKDLRAARRKALESSSARTHEPVPIEVLLKFDEVFKELDQLPIASRIWSALLHDDAHTSLPLNGELVDQVAHLTLEEAPRVLGHLPHTTDVESTAEDEEQSGFKGRGGADGSNLAPKHDQKSAKRAHAAQDAQRAFSILALLLPKRIAAEEIGDALELINHLLREGRPLWQIYLKMATTVFWVSINAIREFSGALLGRKRA